jgi:hypothetical protein
MEGDVPPHVALSTHSKSRSLFGEGFAGITVVHTEDAKRHGEQMFLKTSPHTLDMRFSKTQQETYLASRWALSSLCTAGTSSGVMARRCELLTRAGSFRFFRWLCMVVLGGSDEKRACGM